MSAPSFAHRPPVARRSLPAATRLALRAALLALGSVAPALAQGSTTVEFRLPAEAHAEGAGQVAVELTLSAPAPGTVTVPFTLSGSATLAADVQITGSSVDIPAGATSALLPIDLVQDTLHEGDEDLVVTLGTPVGASLGAATVHTLTIVDDDPAPSVGFTQFRTVVDELSGGFNVRFQLSAVSGLDVSAPFTISGSASGPSDIIAPVSPAVVPAGQLFVDVPVGLIVDRFPEPGERVVFTLGASPSNATLGAVTSLIVLINDGNAGPLALPPALTATPTNGLDFAPERIGSSSLAQQLTLTNLHTSPVAFLGLEAESGAVGAFSVTYPGGAPPVTLAPGQSVLADVTFAPLATGPREAVFRVRQNYGGIPPRRVTFRGIGIGPFGAEIALNAGGEAFVGAGLAAWSADFGVVASEGSVTSTVPVAGTTDDALYQSSRLGQTVTYAFPLPNGTYDVLFRGWEPLFTNPGSRVFDVTVEGALALDDVDYVALAGPATAWVSPTQRVTLTDGVLDIEFVASVGRAIVSTLEVRSVPVVTSPTVALDFGTVEQGSFGQLDIEFVNAGLAPGRIVGLQIVPGVSGPADEFEVELGGALYAGAAGTASYAVDQVLAPGTSTFVPVLFTPTVHRDNDLQLRFTVEGGGVFVVEAEGTGGANVGWGFLHPVIDLEPRFVVDFDGSGSEPIELLGFESHTHEPGKVLTGFEWRVNGNPVGTTVNTPVTLPVGTSLVSLTITDSNVPPATATDSRPVAVHPANAVPGILARYYDGSIAGEGFLLDNVPARPDFVARQSSLSTAQQGLFVGPSPFQARVMVRWTADFTLGAAATLTFAAQGGDGRRVLVNGNNVSAPLALGAGVHSLDVRFAVSDVADLPLSLSVTEAGAPLPGFEASLTHAEGQLGPVIHNMPAQGTDLGGNDIVIDGFGFFPQSQVVVNWGNATITPAQFTSYTPERIQFNSPPGSGPIQVRVTTPNGTSNSVTFTYSPSGPVPVRWSVLFDRAFSVQSPTCAAWGPDGRLWVGTIDGSLRAVSFDDNWFVTNIQYYAGIVGRSNKDILGLAFNPYDVYNPSNPASLKVYVAHGELFQNGGLSFSGPSLFTGEISRLTGPNFDAATALISGLPVSNHDHSINGIHFDPNGDLFICSGGNTNAGVTWPLMGDVPESPLSGAILKAFTSRATFNGQVEYRDRATAQPIDDQRFGEAAILAPGIDVEVFAPGLRNAYDLVVHSNGYIYATDNGPNDFFGPASLSLTTQGGNPQPDHPDELLHIERENYYGHPNRARAVDDPRQAIYRSDTVPSIPNVFTQRIAHLDSSTNGIEEYRATAFNSQLRGDLIVMKWGGMMRSFRLSQDGRAVLNPAGTILTPWSWGLDIAMAPGGSIFAINYSGNDVRVQVPDDVAAIGLTPYDVFPGRGLNTGGVPFILGGQGFGTLANTSVTFNGVPAVLTSVTSKRIRGIVPAQAATVVGSVPVAVTVNATTVQIPAAFQYLPAQPGRWPGFWRTYANMPAALGEVAAAEENGMLYVFGEGDGRTFRLDIANGTWNTTLAPRPYPGNHHACEVWNGRLYLFGGFFGGSEGRVQIYDPATNTWSLGAPMPWSGGSCVSGRIGTQVYVGGGIVGSSTVANFAVYDLVANTWTALGALPVPVNHAAAATDGQRLFIFGGRQGPNWPQPGFSTVQVYNPVTQTWQTSGAGQVAPMPLPRGGTGRAVWYRGEFYVFGGEDDLVTFAEVQAYNPATNAWRRDANLPTARHGIFPVKYGDRIFVIGGGVAAGNSASGVFEVFQRP